MVEEFGKWALIHFGNFLAWMFNSYIALLAASFNNQDLVIPLAILFYCFWGLIWLLRRYDRKHPTNSFVTWTWKIGFGFIYFVIALYLAPLMFFGLAIAAAGLSGVVLKDHR